MNIHLINNPNLNAKITICLLNELNSNPLNFDSFHSQFYSNFYSFIHFDIRFRFILSYKQLRDSNI